MFDFCEPIGRPGRKVKEFSARMGKMPSTMVLHKYVYGADTIFSTMVVTLENNPMAEWLGVIRRGAHQAASEYIRWAYGTVSDFWIDIEPGSDSSDAGLINEGIKDQEKLEDQ